MTGITIEHAQIVRWAQNRQGRPAIDRSSKRVRPIIRFPNEGDDNLVSWEEWTSVFDRDEWAFIYQDRTPEGERSRNWKIIPRFEPESQWSCEVKITPGP
jgi:hypothetical protein